ncbi:hypothetical protein B0H10DRAFT_1747427, partial [Mycena sp. CBHHK59/15]
LQIGSQMASMYLLGNPDHYTGHKFKVFWWKSYVFEVNRSWFVEEHQLNPDVVMAEVSPAVEDTDRLVLTKNGDGYVGTSNVDDYTFCSHSLENTCLYDYFQMAERK